MKKNILLGLGALILIAAIGQAFGIIKPKTEEERPTPTIKQEVNSQVTDTEKEPVKIIGHRFDTVDREIRLIILFNRPLSEDEVGNFLYPNYTYNYYLTTRNGTDYILDYGESISDSGFNKDFTEYQIATGGYDSDILFSEDTINSIKVTLHKKLNEDRHNHDYELISEYNFSIPKEDIQEVVEKEPVKIVGHRFDEVDGEVQLIILFNRPLSKDEVGSIFYPNYTYKYYLTTIEGDDYILDYSQRGEAMDNFDFNDDFTEYQIAKSGNGMQRGRGYVNDSLFTEENIDSIKVVLYKKVNEDRYNHDYEMIDEYNFPTKEENSEKDTETSTLKD